MARWFRTPVLRFLAAAVLLLGAALLVGDTSTPKITKHDKAYYADAKTVNFVQPGLSVKVLSHSIAGDGTVKARFKIADGKGAGLDRDGITTPGPVTVRLIIAYIGQGWTRYFSYTKSASSGLPGTDTGGTFESLGNGEYNYTFAKKLPVDYPKGQTHTIGIQASRNLSEFGMSNYADNSVYHFVPDGSKVTFVRDIVKTETCNQCHDPLSAHGSRRKVEYCILCHQPEANNYNTGINFDFPVLIHKIHQGSGLPSVVAGKPYKIGNTDFSQVNFPADTRNCEVCHAPKSGAAQADAWLTHPTRDACGACHDNVNFATGENHLNLPQVSDTQCATCHTPKGELEFDASIRGAHVDPRVSTALTGAAVQILSVTGKAGEAPTVTFTIKDKIGHVIPPSAMDRFALVLAGPTTDYQTYVSEDARKATGPAETGPFTWKFASPLPANAAGTYTIGTEGYRFITLLAGTKKQQTVRDTVPNLTFNFTVDGSKLAARRVVVTLDKCNACHFKLEAHGRNRNTIEECVLCHNPARTETGRPSSAGNQQSISFRTMVHGIHAGAEREGGYAVYGSTGTKNDFSGVGYPGDLRNCQKCHVAGTEAPPLADTVSSVNDPQAPITPVGPLAAACTACHNSRAVYSHALANTTSLGENCASCHSATSEFSVSKVHAR